MSVYDEEYHEPEGVLAKTITEEVEKVIRFSVEVSAEEFANQIKGYVANNLKDMISRHVRSEIENGFKTYGYDKEKKDMSEELKKIMREMFAEKLNTTYPDVVENKANQLVEEIKKVSLSDLRSTQFSLSNLASVINQKLEQYMDAEFKRTVKEAKDNIELFAKNYFVNNLFKAMDVMGGSLPGRKE